MFPFFPYNGYGPHHQSFPVGWEACLTLFIHKVFSPLFFPHFFVWKVVRKRLVVWPHLQGLGQNGFENYCGSPLSTSFTLRFLSWLGLPGESLIPTEHATRLEGVLWYWIVTSYRSPPRLSGTCTPICFNLLRERWVCSPVSFMGGIVDCWPVTSWKGVSLVSCLILFTNIASASRISPALLVRLPLSCHVLLNISNIICLGPAYYLLLLWIFLG